MRVCVCVCVFNLCGLWSYLSSQVKVRVVGEVERCCFVCVSAVMDTQSVFFQGVSDTHTQVSRVTLVPIRTAVAEFDSIFHNFARPYCL